VEREIPTKKLVAAIRENVHIQGTDQKQQTKNAVSPSSQERHARRFRWIYLGGIDRGCFHDRLAGVFAFARIIDGKGKVQAGRLPEQYSPAPDGSPQLRG
jgi:hypothetical protein